MERPIYIYSMNGPYYKYLLPDDLPLPDVLINIIYNFIRAQDRTTLNKVNYITYNTCLVFPTSNLESFIRKVVHTNLTFSDHFV